MKALKDGADGAPGRRGRRGGRRAGGPVGGAADKDAADGNVLGRRRW